MTVVGFRVSLRFEGTMECRWLSGPFNLSSDAVDNLAGEGIIRCAYEVACSRQRRWPRAVGLPATNPGSDGGVPFTDGMLLVEELTGRHRGIDHRPCHLGDLLAD